MGILTLPCQLPERPCEAGGRHLSNCKVPCPGRAVAGPESLGEAGGMAEPSGRAAWAVMEARRAGALVGSNPVRLSL